MPPTAEPSSEPTIEPTIELPCDDGTIDGAGHDQVALLGCYDLLLGLEVGQFTFQLMLLQGQPTRLIRVALAA